MSKLFVSNFPEHYVEEDIDLIFSPFGRIKSIRMGNETRLFAIVEFETVQSSKSAMAALRGRRLYECSECLHIEPAFDRKRRVVVEGVPGDTTEAALQGFFSYYGGIENITYHGERETVLIDFKLQEDAERLLELDRKVKFQGSENRLAIKPFAKKAGRERTDSPDRCVFVYNLSPKTTERDVVDSFARFGEIVSSGVLSGGKGFVNYEKDVSALKAVRHMDGKKIGGKRIRVTLKSTKKRRP